MSSWTKKHFVLVAKTVDDVVKDKEIKTNLCGASADKFKVENPLFDDDKFMTACRT